MATVVTVHGTFAHSAGTADALNIGPQSDPQWWQGGSEFEDDLKRFATGTDGRLDFVPFTWSSFNSETDRRNAGSELLKVLRGLDKKNEAYCLVGHSHGGSVIASALIESVARNKPLQGLKRWITVGTPFVGMRKEKFLFTRLTLTRKVMFVASLMLFMMFFFYAVGEFFSEGTRVRSERHYIALMFSATMMTLPIVVSYLFFRYLDNRELYGYGRGIVQRLRDAYAGKWLPLCHKDDEAVQGLRYLPKVKFHFFNDDFAASTLTKASIVILPLAYLLIVTSPNLMLGLADFLQERIYDVKELAKADDPATKARDELKSLADRMQQARDQTDTTSLDASGAEEARRRAGDLRRELWAKRKEIEEKFPQFADVERAQRFKRKFLQKDRQPCEGGRLCGLGHDYALNSKLLFHVVTDELSSAVVDEAQIGGPAGGILRLLTPIVLVPLAFAALALLILGIVQYIANFLSVYISRGLNTLTLSEVKRSTFGNDTEGEVVLGADYGPTWLEPVTCLLPTEISDGISEHSNTVTASSLAKFRNAISTLAFAEGEDSKSGVISNYLTWKELVHTCYFDLREFRKMVARSISQAEGFMPTEAFQQDADFDRTGLWLAALGKKKDAIVETGLVAGVTPPVSFPA